MKASSRSLKFVAHSLDCYKTTGTFRKGVTILFEFSIFVIIYFVIKRPMTDLILDSLIFIILCRLLFEASRSHICSYAE